MDIDTASKKKNPLEKTLLGDFPRWNVSNELKFLPASRKYYPKIARVYFIKI